MNFIKNMFEHSKRGILFSKETIESHHAPADQIATKARI